jgi:hypothetical protein
VDVLPKVDLVERVGRRDDRHQPPRGPDRGARPHPEPVQRHAEQVPRGIVDPVAPPGSPLLHSIRPIKAFFDGRHYCTLDWHLITIAYFTSAEELNLSTNNEVKAFLEATTVTFSLDGVPTPAAETTSVKAANSEFTGAVPPGEWFWRAWGNFYAPGVLPVGKHSLTGSGTDPIGSFKLDRITFYIDPVGSGACL